MDYFVDVTVLPDPEFSEILLMSALYAKLHRTLVAVGKGQIGVSFPKVARTPGPLLRLHSHKAALERLMAAHWLKGLRDYTETSGASVVPADVSYVIVKRFQPKQSSAQIRRAVKRQSLTANDAETLLQQRTGKITHPFVRMVSSSTGQGFPLFLEHSEPLTQPVSGTFSSYGLSQGATVPWF